MIMTIIVLAMMNNDYDIHNVWMQFTIYTSLGGDNFKWNVSTLLSALLVHLYLYLYLWDTQRVYLFWHCLAGNWEKFSANFLIEK